MAFQSLIIVTGFFGLFNALPIDTDQITTSPIVPQTTTSVHLTRRQLDISGGSIIYDDSDSAIVTESDESGPSAVVVYEIAPRFIDGWKSSSSNLLPGGTFAVEEAFIEEEDAMEVAETHLFRPLFRYRAVQENKNRQKRIEDDN